MFRGINLHHSLQANGLVSWGRFGDWLLGKMISYFHLTASLQQCDFNWLHLFRTAKSIENNVCSAAEMMVKPDRRLVASPPFPVGALSASVFSLLKRCLPMPLSTLPASHLLNGQRWRSQLLSFWPLQLSSIYYWCKTQQIFLCLLIDLNKNKAESCSIRPLKWNIKKYIYLQNLASFPACIFYDHCKLTFANIICKFNLWCEKIMQWRMPHLHRVCQNYYSITITIDNIFDYWLVLVDFAKHRSRW